MAPSAHAACSRTPAFSSVSTLTSASTAPASSMAPRAHAACFRTVAALSARARASGWHGRTVVDGAERPCRLRAGPSSASSSAWTSPGVARGSSSAPRAHAACRRTPASASFSAAINAGTACVSSMAPSAHADCSRTGASRSRNVSLKPPTARLSSRAPSAHAAFRRATHASRRSADNKGSNDRVPMAASAAAASSPGLVSSFSPFRDQRWPQVMPSTGAASANKVTSGGMASTARSPSSRSPQAARVRDGRVRGGEIRGELARRARDLFASAHVLAEAAVAGGNYRQQRTQGERAAEHGQ